MVEFVGRSEFNMPVTSIPLDSSIQEENVTLLHGRNILIKLIEDQKTQYLMADSAVKVFLSTEDMTCKEFRETIQEMVKLDDEIEQVLEGKYFPTSMALDYLMRDVLISFEDRDLAQATHAEKRRKKRKKKLSEVESKRADLRKRITEASINELSKKDEEIIEHEKKLKSFNHKLSILDTLAISRCSKCGNFISEEESTHTSTHSTRSKSKPNPETHSDFYFAFDRSTKRGRLMEVREKMKCPTCGKAVTPRNVLNLTLHRLHPSIKKVWERNLWLEQYLSKILKSFGWKTWPHVHVLGSSGIRHEVDVLGVKDGYVLVCECKTGNVSRQDVFNFWTKTYDIKSHLSILALIQELPEPETRQFVLKNPSVTLLENLGEKTKGQIMSELKSGVIQRI